MKRKREKTVARTVIVELPAMTWEKIGAAAGMMRTSMGTIISGLLSSPDPAKALDRLGRGYHEAKAVIEEFRKRAPHGFARRKRGRPRKAVTRPHKRRTARDKER